MSLNTQIATIVEALYPDAFYILSSKFQANIQSFTLEASELPLIILDNELRKTASIKQNANVIKDTRIMMTFLNKDDANNTDVQSEAIRQSMEDIADKIAVNIYQLDEVRPSGNQQYTITPLFHAYATDLTGVVLEMNVNYNTIVNFCKTLPIPD